VEVGEAVAADREEPWSQRFQVTGWRLPDEAQKRFLHGIPRGFVIGSLMPRERQQGTFKAVEDGLEIGSGRGHAVG